jgi:DNA-binding CsgD family transcriptional regulator/catechol 2,3-dioxygenase-like lactoylglutathione lyase family enzyme
MRHRPRGRPRYDDVLTPTEWRIVHAIQHGMTTRDIARRRGVSVDAVKYHVSNVLGKLHLADRSALRGWFAVPRDSALRKQRRNTMADIKLGAIGQVSRSVRDLTESKAWYGEQLGLPHLYTFGKMAFFDCDGTRLLLNEVDEVTLTEAVLYFHVEDIQTAFDALSARGIEFESPPHRIHRHDDGTEEWMAFFNDPEGRPLAIMAQPRPL